MTREAEARRRAPRVIPGLVVFGLVLTGVWGIALLAAKPGESAPTERQALVGVPAETTEGGITAELSPDDHAVVYATRGLDGGLSVGCTDSASAAALVAEVAP
jgi:hypothetical protein